VPGQQWPSAFLGAKGHAKVVQLALLRTPLSGQVHMFTPSPAGKLMPGLHSCSDGCAKQFMWVHEDSFFRPLAGQMHELQPSEAMNDAPAQHLSLGSSPWLLQSSSVHSASFFDPLHGQVHVLQPSSAGYVAPGRQSSPGGTGHPKSVQSEELFLPLHGHMHMLKPSPAG